MAMVVVLVMMEIRVVTYVNLFIVIVFVTAVCLNCHR